MSLINDALKKAQHVQALKGSGAPAAYHPAPSKDAAPAEPISNVMPDIKPSGGRLGTYAIVAVLGLAALGGAGYMFFLRSDAEPVVVERRPAPAAPATPATALLGVTPFEPVVVPETSPVAAVVEPVATPPAPKPAAQPTAPVATTPTEKAVVTAVPEPVAQPALIIDAQPIAPAAPASAEPVAVTEPSPITPIETIANPEPAVAEVETPAAAEPPALVIAEAPAPEPAVVEPISTPEPVGPAAAPTPAPAVAVIEPAVTSPAPARAPIAAPRPPPEPATVADPEIQNWVSTIKVAGLRMGPVPKVLMNDRVYAQGEMVQFDFELRLIEITETLLKFKDPKGHVYFFRL